MAVDLSNVVKRSFMVKTDTDRSLKNRYTKRVLLKLVRFTLRVRRLVFRSAREETVSPPTPKMVDAQAASLHEERLKLKEKLRSQRKIRD